VVTQVNGKKKDLSTSRLRSPAVGLEAEFSLVIDDVLEKPEDVFENPRAFIRGPLQHRRGSSYQLPGGAAVYFDTGVIELATPPIEMERGCMARAGRLLWESIAFLRGELDSWQHRSGRVARLVGFSTHYNVSIDRDQTHPRRLGAMAKLLTYILPPPVMLLATNRFSNGIGVRPRPGRIEVTSDFTPDPARMIAAGALIAGVVRKVATWDSFALSTLETHGIPRIRRFKPMPHTSRRGWLARHDCFARNPMAGDPAAPIWHVFGRAERVSLRDIAAATFSRFRHAVAAVAEPASLREIEDVLSGRTQSFLDLAERPAGYEDVGRLCSWPEAEPYTLNRSRFEEIVRHTMAKDKLRIDNQTYTPSKMHGWSGIVFRRDSDGRRKILSLDELVAYLPQWD